MKNIAKDTIKNKKEKRFALILFIVVFLIGILSIVGVNKTNLTGMAMVKIVEYTGNPIYMLLAAIGLIIGIALLYSYLFMRS